MGAPTCLPSWWDIHKMVAESLAERAAELEGAERSRKLAAEIIARQRSERFPPEYQAEIVAGRLPKDYFEVLQCLDSDAPNATHLAMAALARSGKLNVIVTTNFDRAIEAAFRQLDVPLVVHSRPEDFAALAQDFGRFADRDCPCQLLKVHGSSEDPATLIDTLAQRKRGFSAPLHACIRHLLRFGHWLFLGYSGADLAAEENYLHLRGDSEEAKGFTWLVRRDTEPLACVQRLKELYGDRATISKGKLPGWMTELVESISPDEARQLPDFSGLDPEPLSAEARRRVEAHVRQWANNQRFDRCMLVFADLLAATNQPEEALGLVQKLQDSTLPADRASMHFGVVLNSLANLYSERGRYDRALELFHQSLALYDEKTWPVQHAGNLINMALAVLKSGDSVRAVDLLERALDLLGEKDPEARGVALHNLALACGTLGRDDEAIRHFKEETELLRHLGDEVGRGQALNDLGNFWVSKGDLAKAIGPLEESRDIRTRLGDERGRAHALGNLANVHFSRKEFAEARRRYEEVLSIFTHFDDRPHVATSLGNLASVALEEKCFDEAAAWVEKALKLYGSTEVQADSLVEQIDLLQKLGAIRSRQGPDWSAEAIRSFEAARVIHKRVRLPLKHRTCLMELGIVYRNCGRLAEAEACFREALAVSETLARDPEHDLVVEHVANILNRLGLAAQENRELDRAEALFQESANLWKKQGSLFNLGVTLKNIGGNHLMAGAPDAALRTWSEAIDYLDQVPSDCERMEILCTMGQVEFVLGSLDKAVQRYSEAWTRCTTQAQRELVRDRLGDFAAQLAAKSQPHPALRLYRQCLRFNEEMNNEPGMAATEFNIGAVLFLQLQQPGEALPLLRQAAETFARLNHPFLGQARKLLTVCEAEVNARRK